MKDLNRVRRSKIAYEQLLIKVEQLETLATHITANLTGMPKAEGKSPDEIWAMLADYKNQCIGAVYQYLRDCKELDAEIDSLPYDPNTEFQIRAVMKCRYLDGMTGADISEKLHYSERYVRELISRGRTLYNEKYGYGSEDNDVRV